MDDCRSIDWVYDWNSIWSFRYSNKTPQHYKYRIQGDSKLYKMNKLVTETWADGLAKWECIELVDDNKKTLNVED